MYVLFLALCFKAVFALTAERVAEFQKMIDSKLEAYGN